MVDLRGGGKNRKHQEANVSTGDAAYFTSAFIVLLYIRAIQIIAQEDLLKR